MKAERLQKIIAEAGLCARRDAEELIREGLVSVNGKVAKLGQSALWGKDAIKVKGKLLTKLPTRLYLACYKPRNVIAMMKDPEGRPALGDYLAKIKERLFPIGRLAFEAEGLVLVTNDGRMTEALQKSPTLRRTYEIKLKGRFSEEKLSNLRIRERNRKGKANVVPDETKILSKLTQKTVIECIIEGSGFFDLKLWLTNRGFLVDRIRRTHIGDIGLEDLSPGSFRYLKPAQMDMLL
jgi:23S rRNA pseudouridine2605 synthase